MKLGYIDVLRGIAILSVVWFHCHMNHFSDPAYLSLPDRLGALGALGVQLFYALSAFTLFLSHHRRRESNRPAAFFLRRFFRIAPMYYVAIGYYLWQDMYAYGQSLDSKLHLQAPALIINGLLLHGISPYHINEVMPGGWSVGVEMLFYAMLPWLVVRITTLNRAVLFTASAVLLGYTLTAVLFQLPALRSDPFLNLYLFQWMPYQLPVFGCGIIAYFLVFMPEQSVSKRVAAGAAGVISLLLTSKLTGRLFQFDLPPTLPLFAGMGFAGLIVWLSRQPIWLMVNSATRYVGEISYSAYLLHFGVLYWANKMLPQQVIPVNSAGENILNFTLKFLLVLLTTVLLSSVTYKLIEIPMQQVGKRLWQVYHRTKNNSLSMTH